MSERTYHVIQLPETTTSRIFTFLTGAIAFTVLLPPIINSVLTILLLLFWALAVPKSFAGIKNVFLVSSIFWIAVAGMVYTTDLDEGSFRLQQKALLFVLSLIYFTAQVDRQRISKIALSLFVAGVLVSCFYCLVEAMWAWSQQGDVARFSSHGLAQAIDIYPYIFAVCCVLSQLILVEALRGKVVLFSWMLSGITGWLLIGCLVIFTFLLSVQQVLIIWLLLLAFLVIRHVRRNIHRVILIAATAILSLAAVLWVEPLRVKVNELLFDTRRNTIPLDDEAAWTNEWNGISVRKAIWTCSIDVIRENPLFGVGTGDAQHALQAAYTNRKFYLAALYNRYNTHNQYIQTLVCFGFTGLVLWAASLAIIFRQFRRSDLFVLSSVCVYLSMLTESALETNKGNLVLAVVTSIFLLLETGKRLAKRLAKEEPTNRHI